MQATSDEKVTSHQTYKVFLFRTTPEKPVENSEAVVHFIQDSKEFKPQPSKIFICDVCRKSFKDAWSLKAHQNTHSDFRGYECDWPGCTFSFKTKGSLVRHQRRHTNERPYECHNCKRTFRESGALARHLKARTPCHLQNRNAFPNYGKNLPLQKKEQPSFSGMFGMVNQIPTQTDNLEKEDLLGDDIMNGVSIANNDFLTDWSKSHDSTSILPTAGLIMDQSLLDQSQCSFEEVNIQNDVENLVESDEISTFLCSACGQTCDSREDLMDHLKSHLLPPGYKCSLCNYLAANTDALKLHIDITKHIPDLQTILSIDDYLAALPDPGTSHYDTLTEEERVTFATFALDQLMEEQEKLTSNEPSQKRANKLQLQCPVCQRYYSSRYLRQHLRSHVGARPYSCEQCGKTFVSRDTLNKHKATHTEERSYACGRCSKTFRRMSHVKEHFKVHGDERPYTCSVCSKTFKSSSACKVHMRTHDDYLPYQCNVCAKRFREKGSIERHFRTHTGERPYVCPYCGKSFVEHGALSRHFKAKVPCVQENNLPHTSTLSTEAEPYELSFFQTNSDNTPLVFDCVNGNFESDFNIAE